MIVARGCFGGDVRGATEDAAVRARELEKIRGSRGVDEDGKGAPEAVRGVT